MCLFVLFQALKAGSIFKADLISISEKEVRVWRKESYEGKMISRMKHPNSIVYKKVQ